MELQKSVRGVVVANAKVYTIVYTNAYFDGW